MLNDGSYASMSVFLVAFLAYFDIRTGTAAGIISCREAMAIIPAPFIGVLNKKYGSKPLVLLGGLLCSIGLFASSFVNNLALLYLTFGVMEGLGNSLIYGPSIVIVGQHIQKRHALANGMSYAGAALGMIVFSPIYQLLITEYGWRGALMIVSAINMNIVVCGMLMRSPPKVDNMGPNNEGSISEDVHIDTGNMCSQQTQLPIISQNRKLGQSGTRTKQSQIYNVLGLNLFCQNSAFCVLCISVFFMGIGHLLTIVHYVNHAVTMGIPKMNASILMSMIGISSLVGRCTHGLFANLRYFTPMSVYVFSTTGAGTVLMLLPLTKGNYYYMAIISLLFGLCSGTYFPLAAVCVKQAVGVDSFPKAFGWFVLCLGTGTILGPYLG
uniref:Monocarboxylate transporter 12-like n=1 Tax=Saccoglossus kowalevskii TaxID=10224 RepID=A0ABM0M6B3_SACKO